MIVDIQWAIEPRDYPGLPSDDDLCRWATSALMEQAGNEDMTIRVVDSNESQQLNHQYRGKDKPTNVLSFPSDLPEEIGINLLGDLVICAPVVAEEAKQQSKPLLAHWAHMVIHGTLHLQGYDHIEDDQAEAMEALEIKLLQGLNFANPY